MKTLSRLLIAISTIVVLSAASPITLAQAANCLTNAQIQQAVADGQILSLNEILQKAGVERSTKVLPPVRVCDKDGKFYYQLALLTSDGYARNLVLQALTGQP